MAQLNKTKSLYVFVNNILNKTIKWRTFHTAIEELESYSTECPTI